MRTSTLTHNSIIFNRDYVTGLAEREWAKLTQAIMQHTHAQNNVESPEDLADAVFDQLKELELCDGSLNMDLKGDTSEEIREHSNAIESAYAEFNAKITNKLGIQLNIRNFDDEMYSFDTAENSSNKELQGLQFVAKPTDVFMPKPQFRTQLENETAKPILYRTIF